MHVRQVTYLSFEIQGDAEYTTRCITTLRVEPFLSPADIYHADGGMSSLIKLFSVQLHSMISQFEHLFSLSV
jgi:hypothetical protein